MIDDFKMMKEEEERRLKEEAEAKERAKKRLEMQTKAVRCTLMHGSRIGLRASKTGYGLGVYEDGGQCIVNRLVGVQYAEQLEADGPESSPDRRLREFAPLQVGDRIVKVGDTLTPECDLALKTIKENGSEPLELTVMRDPAEVPQQQWRRDRLWNYSHKLYWATFFSMISVGFSLLCFLAYKISQLEPAPQGTFDNEDFYPHGMYGGSRMRRHTEL